MAIGLAANLDIVHLLIKAGADLGNISEAMRAAVPASRGRRARCFARGLPDGPAAVFGRTNPEGWTCPFGGRWSPPEHPPMRPGNGSMTPGHANRSGASGASANPSPSARRPDRRDRRRARRHYDPDFCIYNDVFVHHGTAGSTSRLPQRRLSRRLISHRHARRRVPLHHRQPGIPRCAGLRPYAGLPAQSGVLRDRRDRHVRRTARLDPRPQGQPERRPNPRGGGQGVRAGGRPGAAQGQPGQGTRWISTPWRGAKNPEPVRVQTVTLRPQT